MSQARGTLLSFGRGPRDSWRSAGFGLLLVAASWLVIGAGSVAGAKVPAKFYGVSPVMNLSQSEMNLAKAGGVTTLRPVLAWPDLEPARGTFAWAKTDQLVTDAAKSGLDLSPLLLATPTWASGCRGGGRCIFKPPVGKPRLSSDWGDYLKALVGRYGPTGTFWSDPLHLLIPYSPIRSWIIWNEENGKGFFPPRASPAKYASLLRNSANSLRSVDPAAQIVLGGLAGGGNVDRNTGSMPAHEFLKALYKQGAASSFDVVALHPYSPTVKDFKSEIAQDRTVMRKAHDGRTPIWLTEVGWGSNRSSSSLSKGVQGQAKLLKQAFRLVEQKQQAWKVQKLFWFTWRDYGGTPCLWCGSSGLFTKGLKPKPAWSAFKRFAR